MIRRSRVVVLGLVKLSQRIAAKGVLHFVGTIYSNLQIESSTKQWYNHQYNLRSRWKEI